MRILINRSLYSCLLAYALAGLTQIAEAAFGDEAWSFAAQDSISSSVCLDSAGNLYFGSFDNRVYSIDKDGNFRWSRLTGDWVQSSPALSLDESVVYLGSWDNKLYALQATSGAVLWTYETDSLVFGSPAIGADGSIYFGSSDGFFYALNPDGSLQWDFVAGDEIDSSPSLDAAGNIYFGTVEGEVISLQADGALRWAITLPDEPGADERGKEVISSPALDADGSLYIGCSNYFFYSLNASSGAIQWKYETGESIEASATLGIDGSVVFASQDGFLYSLDTAGNLLWSQEIGVSFFSTPTIDELGRIYIGVEVEETGSRLCAVSPYGNIIWQFDVGDYIDSSPALSSEGVAYFGSYDGKVYAVETGGALAAGPWSKFGRSSSNQSSQAGYVLPIAGAERLVNISLRGPVLGGDSIVVAGFVINGGGDKGAVVRSVGPTLELYGVNDALQDPFLEVSNAATNPSSVVASNDDWGDFANVPALETAFQAVGAFSLQEASLDSALLLELPGGVYTASATSSSEDTGIALAEVYDADADDAATRLVNVSMRGYVGVGEAALFSGFVYKGNLPRQFLIRAIGKSLEDYGVSGALNDPQLLLYKGSRVVASNDNWDENPDRFHLEQAAANAGAFEIAEGSQDSAMFVWLEPGDTYAAFVSGVGGATGIALVEIYDLGL